MSDIDISAAKDIFALLHDPVLDVEECIVRKKSPELDDGAVLDLALAAAIARLHFTLNKQTFEYLRWKVMIARATAQATIEELRVAREHRANARVQRSRTFRDPAGMTWTVTETYCRIGSAPEQRCLVFASDVAVRRVKTIPDAWEEMDDAALAAISWSR